MYSVVKLCGASRFSATRELQLGSSLRPLNEYVATLAQSAQPKKLIENTQLLTTVTEQCREFLCPTRPPSESARILASC
jgi:hypothetical protein